MKKRIIVVDDDLSVRESLKKVLEEAGYEVMVAADGQEAQGKLNEPSLDLLILDLNMPNRDGWDVLEDLNMRRPMLPVIVVTGMIDQLATTQIPGIAALMPKPLHVSVLLNKIEELLAEAPEARLRRQSRDEIEPWVRVGHDNRF